MSLVAYEASSDEESNYSDDDEQVKAEILQPRSIKSHTVNKSTENINGSHISDDEDDEYAPVDLPLQDLRKPAALTLSLPKPKVTQSSTNLLYEINDDMTPKFAQLPMPKISCNTKEIIIEEDDEFLRKKATPVIGEEKEKFRAPLQQSIKGPVKITIPSLKDFSDVDKELEIKIKTKSTLSSKSKGSGLLSILPTAKSEQNFAKVKDDRKTNVSDIPKAYPAKRPPPSLIPDTVKNRRPAHNTEGVDGIKAAKKNKSLPSAKISLVDCSGSEESEDEIEPSMDFFSLKAKDELPEISKHEIDAFVAKRAAQLDEIKKKYYNTDSVSQRVGEEDIQPDDEEMRQAQKRYHEQKVDAEVIEALVGGGAKRRRNQKQEIQIIDITSNQVMPNREEWMRTALASSTSYQATGVLVDEEPAAGTRRKHQITYLAHKAKANEAELQAMWSANRHNRRATQSKYGF